jgi:di/tricarboxylate transporter
MNQAPSIKRSATIFLQVVVVLIGVIVLALMLWEPHLEGRNAHATTFEIYFKDPFLAYAYTASIAFFVALYQAFTLLGYIGRNQVFSLDSVRALRIIKYCAIALVAMIGAAVAYLFIAVRGKDDIAGGVAMGVLMSFVSVVIATAAAVFERLLQKAVDMKAENDLTV